MKENAIYYYRQGYNCSACILKAAEKYYNKNITRQSYSMCQGINTGFGVGGMCSVLIAGIMVFGLFYDNETVKRLRINLLNEFRDRHRSMNCADLIKDRKGGAKCEAIVGEIAEIVEKLIEKESYV